MDAPVRQCVISVLLLCVISLSGHSSGYSNSKEELFNCRTTMSVNLFPVFIESAVDLLQNLISKVRHSKERKTGRHGPVSEEMGTLLHR